MMMGSLTSDHRTLLLIFAALAGDVYMICESRVIRAQSPLVIRDESAEAAEHPPDGEGK
jgi:HAMP domain-containing protein